MSPSHQQKLLVNLHNCMYILGMGKKNHSIKNAFGEGKLKDLAAEIGEGDGQRYAEGQSATHKGLGKKPKYKEKHKGKQGWRLGY